MKYPGSWEGIFYLFQRKRIQDRLIYFFEWEKDRVLKVLPPCLVNLSNVVIFSGGDTVEFTYKEYAIRDHLGNTRLMFTDKNGNNVIDITGTASTNDILQENHYYGFGLSFEGLWLMDDAGRDNPYRYNNKELNEDFGLDWYDYGARWYDASIGRWNAVDPLAEEYYSISQFVYTNNNPVRYIDPNGMYFTERSEVYIERLLENMNNRLSRLDGRIANAEERGNERRVKRLTQRRNELSENFAVVESEIEGLRESDQTYDIYVSDKFSESGPIPGTGVDRGGATFNFSTGTFEIILPNGFDEGFIAHELKHAYQFEKGEYSVGPRLTRDEAPHRNLLYDKSDEVAGYERGALFGQRTYTANTLPSIYDDVSDAPVKASTHPVMKNIMNIPEALQRIARVTGHAFRINGKTYYRRR